MVAARSAAVDGHETGTGVGESDMTNYFTQFLTDEAATLQAARQLAAHCHPGQVIYLHGDLGAGKTTLVRGMLQALGHSGKVKSPTYTLVEPYALAPFTVYHFDLYRFQDAEEWEAAGFREYFNPSSVCLVEWPERASAVLPLADIDIQLEILPSGRQLHVRSASPLAWEA